MAAKVVARVQPDLLRWARQSRGLSAERAAKVLKTTADRIEAWESGALELTVAQLRRIADAYKRPLIVFYLPQPPEGFDAMRDFRTLPPEESSEISLALRVEIERAQQRREIALDLARDLASEPSQVMIAVSPSDDPDAAAAAIRAALGIEMREQLGWTDKYQAFQQWREAVERIGVLVFQTTLIPMSEMRGFSISERIFPVIALNGQDSPRGKIFSIMHELTHIALHSGGVCDFRDTGEVEAFCNRVAGAVLVPSADLLSAPTVISRGRDPKWTDEEIGRLADSFSVSREVILRRLLLLGRTTESFYREKRDEFNRLYREYRLAEKAKRKQKKGGPRHFRMALRNNGLPYTRLVLSSYYEDLISVSEVSDYLGVRHKHIADIEHAVFRRAADSTE